MQLNRSVTAAELDEARRLIARSQQNKPVRRGGKVASGVAPAVGAVTMAWQRNDPAPAAAGADTDWRATEWCETTVEPRA